LAIDLHPPPRSAVRRVRGATHANAVFHILLLLSLLAIPIGGAGAVGGFALVLLGAGTANLLGETLSFLGGTRASAQALYGGVGAVEILVATVLLQREQVDMTVVVTTLVLVASLFWIRFRMVLLQRRTEKAEIVRDETSQSQNPS
jgi:hypothetical protein